MIHELRQAFHAWHQAVGIIFTACPVDLLNGELKQTLLFEVIQDLHTKVLSSSSIDQSRNIYFYVLLLCRNSIRFWFTWIAKYPAPFNQVNSVKYKSQFAFRQVSKSDVVSELMAPANLSQCFVNWHMDQDQLSDLSQYMSLVDSHPVPTASQDNMTEFGAMSDGSRTLFATSLQVIPVDLPSTWFDAVSWPTEENNVSEMNLHLYMASIDWKQQ